MEKQSAALVRTGQSVSRRLSSGEGHDDDDDDDNSHADERIVGPVFWRTIREQRWALPPLPRPQTEAPVWNAICPPSAGLHSSV